MSRTSVPLVAIQVVRECPTRYRTIRVGTPHRAAEIAREILGWPDREHFLVLALDMKQRVNAVHVAHIGTLSSTDISPREIFKFALLANAAAVIAAHNHPSGDPSPSYEDFAATGKLVRAGNVLGVEVLDHIILGDNGFVSLREVNGSLFTQGGSDDAVRLD